MNHVVLSAQLVERGALRYTPAGLPALDCVLRHESQLTEAGHARKVSLEIRAVALGEVSRPLAALQIGSTLDAMGFLASHRNGRGVILHITEVRAA
jgi:primosomal replication protein N